MDLYAWNKLKKQPEARNDVHGQSNDNSTVVHHLDEEESVEFDPEFDLPGGAPIRVTKPSNSRVVKGTY